MSGSRSPRRGAGIRRPSLCLLGLSLLAPAPGAAQTAVVYSVGTTFPANLMSGSPTVTIAAGTATFSSPQLDLVGVGDQITYGGATKAYVTARASSTVYSVRTATGLLPGAVASAVVSSITRAFGTLTAAEVGSTDAAHLGTSDLVAGNFQLHWAMYDDGPMNDGGILINGYTTDVNHYIRIFTPVPPGQVGSRQRHRGLAGTGFRLAPVNASPPPVYDVIHIVESHVRIEGIEIDASRVSGAFGVSGITVDTAVPGSADIRIDKVIVHGLANAAAGAGTPGDLSCILLGNAGAKISNSICYGVHNRNADAGTDTFGIRVPASSTATVYLHNDTVFDVQHLTSTGLVVAGVSKGVNSNVTARNTVALEVRDPGGTRPCFGGTFGPGSTRNVSSDSTAPGSGSQVKQRSYTTYFASVSPGSEDLHLRNDSLAIWSTSGADLDTDPDLPVVDDIDGEARDASLPDIGADEYTAPAGPPLRVASGHYVGSGVTGRFVHVGFPPDAVFVKRVGGLPDVNAVLRTSTMTGDSTKSLDNAGVALAPNLVSSLSPTGFTVGTDTGVNEGPGAACPTGCDYYWVAFAAAPGSLKVGTYTGDGATFQSVAGLGFEPDYVIVLPPGAGDPAGVPVWTSSTLLAAFCFDFDATFRTPGAITALEPDGFQVGQGDLVAPAPNLNVSGTTYHYLAWNAVAGQMAVGTYVGDGQDDRNLDVVGFFPEWALVKKYPDGSVERSVTHKPAATGVATDVGLRFAEIPPVPNTLQGLRPLGFQVGSDERVNSAADCAGPCTYHWVAFGPHEPQTYYRSIGTAPDLVDQGTIALTAGSTLVTKSGGAGWKAANRGRGDRLTVGSDHYIVASVDTDDQLTLLTPAVATVSGPTYTIARQFTTLSGWEDCVSRAGPNTCKRPADTQEYFPTASPDLVADDRREVGIAYKDSPFLLTTDLWIDGSTTDATHTIVLTVDPGNRHDGVAGNGVIVDAQGGPNEFSVRDSNVTVEWLEFRGCRGAIGLNAVEVWAGGGDVATNVLLQSLLVHDFADPTAGHDTSGIALSGDLLGGSFKSVTIRNVMIWDGDNYGIEGDNAADSAVVENVSIDGMLNSGIWAGNSAFTVRNTVVTGSPGGDFTHDVSGSFTGSNNTDSDGTGAAYFANPLTDAAANVFVVPGADLHLRGGVNAQVDSGLDLSSSFSTDIDGQSRSALAWDRGADERDASTSSAVDLSITKDDSQTSAVPGDPVTYTITVTNNGPDTLASLQVLDPAPSLGGAAFLPSAGSYDPASGFWTGLSLAPSQSATLTLSGTIDPYARGSLVNTATVFPPPGVTDTDGSNDAATDTDTLDPSADVKIVKSDDVDPAPLGGLLTYTLTITNGGPSGATNVDVSDPLPADMELDPAPGAITPSQGGCSFDPPTRTVSCSLGDLGPLAAATVTVKVRPQAARTYDNTASVTHTDPDPLSGNDAWTEATVVEVSSLDVRFFTVTSTSQRNVLEWVNPTDADYLATEIVVRGDRFPAGPGDGATIYNSGAGGSGGRVKLPHATGALSNGMTFYYGAFVHRASAPLVSPGRFVTGRPFDHVTGPVKWAFSTGATAMAAPTVGGAGVIATSNDRVVYAMERGTDDDQIGVDSGEWPAAFVPVELGGPVQQRSPVIPITVGTSTPVAYFGAQDGSVYVVDAAQGGAVGFPWSPTPVGAMVQGAPAGIFTAFLGAYDYLLLGTRDATNPNAFVAVDPYTGAVIESYDNGGVGPGAIGIVGGMAAVDYDPPLPSRVYFASHERTPVGSTNTLWCFDLGAAPTVFNPRWARALGDIDGSPVLRGGRVYVGGPQGSPGGTLYSLDALTGGDDRTFVHNDGQVKGFVFPDRLSPTGDLYFATDNLVWGVSDTGGVLANKFASGISLGPGVKPSPVLFVPGSHYLYVGGSDGRLYEIDVAPAVPVVKSVVLGDGAAVVGAPSLDSENDLVHVGTEAGIFYAVQVPLP